MKIKFIALSLCMVASVNIIKAQDTDKSSYQPNNRHEFRIARDRHRKSELCVQREHARPRSDGLHGADRRKLQQPWYHAHRLGHER